MFLWASALALAGCRGSGGGADAGPAATPAVTSRDAESAPSTDTTAPVAEDAATIEDARATEAPREDAAAAPTNPVTTELAPLFDAMAGCGPAPDVGLEDLCEARVKLLALARDAGTSTTSADRRAQVRAALFDEIAGGTRPVARAAALDVYEQMSGGASDPAWTARVIDALRGVDASDLERGAAVAHAVGGELYWCRDEAARKRLVALLADKTLPSWRGRAVLIEEAARKARGQDDAADGTALVEAVSAVARDASERVEIREAAIAGLGETLYADQRRDMLDVVAGLATDPDARVRTAAIAALAGATGEAGAVAARQKLMALITAPESDAATLAAAATSLARLATLDDANAIVAWVGDHRARPGAPEALARFLVALQHSRLDDPRGAKVVADAFDLALGKLALAARDRIDAMVALGRRTGTMLETCTRFIADPTAEVATAAAACVAKAKDPVLRMAGLELRLGASRADVATAIGAKGKLADEEAGADAFGLPEGALPKRSGVTGIVWSSDGVDELHLVFVRDKLTDIVWPSATSGETPLQEKFQADLVDRLGVPARDDGHDVWHLAGALVRRDCWTGGDSGDGGCAYAVIGR